MDPYYERLTEEGFIKWFKERQTNIGDWNKFDIHRDVSVYRGDAYTMRYACFLTQEAERHNYTRKRYVDWFKHIGKDIDLFIMENC